MNVYLNLSSFLFNQLVNQGKVHSSINYKLITHPYTYVTITHYSVSTTVEDFLIL